MTKLEVLQGLATFALSCEANGVELFYYYQPHVNSVSVNVWEGGKYHGSDGIEFSHTIYFENAFLETQLTFIINTVIDKYYKKG